jgi:hypothetical protein
MLLDLSRMVSGSLMSLPPRRSLLPVPVSTLPFPYVFSHELENMVLTAELLRSQEHGSPRPCYFRRPSHFLPPMARKCHCRNHRFCHYHLAKPNSSGEGNPMDPRRGQELPLPRRQGPTRRCPLSLVRYSTPMPKTPSHWSGIT